MTTRPALIHCARVYLAQSRHFTARARRWSFVLLELAAKARREAAACRPAAVLSQPAQGELFGY